MTMHRSHHDDAPELRVLSLVLAFAAGAAMMVIAHNLRHDDTLKQVQDRTAEAIEDGELARGIAHHAVDRAASCMDELARLRAAQPRASVADLPEVRHGR